MLSYTASTVLLGATLIGLVGGVLGAFTLLRRQSLLGDALAHAALPGVCIAFLLTWSKSPLVLFTGALAAGLLGALLILAVVRGSRVKEDAAIGIVLSVFFGVGIVLLTYIQRLPLGNQSGLDKFLFGQAATLMRDDLVMMAILGGLVLATVALCFKELGLLCFDPGFGQSLGFPMRRLEVLFTLLLVTVVVVGLQTVGVVLMVATLITPAAAARQWTDRLGSMVLLSGGIGAFAGATGALASAAVTKLPTGPTIVLVSSAILLVSLLFAPHRGLVWARLRERAVARRVRRENLLKDLYLAAERDGNFDRFVPLPTLMGQRGQSALALRRLLAPLLRGGLVERARGADKAATALLGAPAAAAVRLSAAGRDAATTVVRSHRLWELYLTRRLELPLDHVHRDAEAMEHVLDSAAVEELAQRLGHPTHDPHGRPIPAMPASLLSGGTA